MRTFAIALTLVVAQASAKPKVRARDFCPFPAKQGTRWIYDVRRRAETGSGAHTIKSTSGRLEMEILDVREDPELRLLLIRGNVLEEGQAISILALTPQGEVFSLRNCTVGWSREGAPLLPKPEEVKQAMKDVDPVLGWPMNPGASLRSSTGTGLPGATYQWNVNDVRPLNRKIDGWNSGGRVTTLIFASGPSHEILEFVPGLGITRVFSVHHGSVMEREARLISFRPGKL